MAFRRFPARGESLTENRTQPTLENRAHQKQQDCCVRFAVVVAFHAATLATGRALPLTRTGLSPVGTRQLSWRTKARHFEASLIVQAVSWYLRYPLSYRDIEKLFRERGLAVDHSTLNRW